MTIDARIRFLKIASVALLILPGVLTIAGLVLPVRWMIEAFLDVAVLPVDGAQAVDTDTAKLLAAILGGVLVGFGVMIWRIADTVFRTDPELGASLLVPAICAWFIADSAGSVMAGAWFNAVLNTVILAALLYPVVWRRAALTAA